MDASELSIAYQLIYAGCEPEPGRFTNDLPISSEVWLLYASEFRENRFNGPKDLLLTPHNALGVAALRLAVLDVLHHLKRDGGAGTEEQRDRYVAANESHLLARISFFDLLALLPLTRWWAIYIEGKFSHRAPRAAHGPESQRSNESELSGRVTKRLRSPEFCDWLGERVLDHLTPSKLPVFKQVGLMAAEKWFDEDPPAWQDAIARLVNVAGLYVGLTLLGIHGKPVPKVRARARDETSRVLGTLADCLSREAATITGQGFAKRRSPLWQVSYNRPAEHAVYASRKTIKADAAIRVFDTGGQGVRWAIIDSGVDARHPAFADQRRVEDAETLKDGLLDPSLSRVVLTLDFTRLALITSGRLTADLKARLATKPNAQELIGRVNLIERDLSNGRMIDWAAIEPLLLVDQTDLSSYEEPADSHGTHVAGIIGADWCSAFYERANRPIPTDLVDATDIVGVCPRIEILDLRVFSKTRGADEFAILGALQYVRYLNQSKDKQYVHGVNLSLSLRHDVRNFACGSTPVCLECDRLVGNGVLVVAAAGNYGYDTQYAQANLGGAYRGQSVTDPGNAAAVLTVGSTHRSDPYQYGISYFSSHGPTGDGRNKPDVVAPGEKIVSTVPNSGAAAMDGTSMAAPHVSGIAALVLSRNNELMGHPVRLKALLCKSASDLGRGEVFQGAGLVDALRALQAV